MNSMSTDISNTELIKLAADVMNPKKISDMLVGQVGAALVTDKGNVYKGVCVDTGSGLGFCAERTAISQMITNKEYKIKMSTSPFSEHLVSDFL